MGGNRRLTARIDVREKTSTDDGPCVRAHWVPFSSARAILVFSDSAYIAVAHLLGAFQEGGMYIDPGTGSLVIQVVSASIIAILASLRRVRDVASRLFSRRRPQ